jgi:hypothetical protein
MLDERETQDVGGVASLVESGGAAGVALCRFAAFARVRLAAKARLPTGARGEEAIYGLRAKRASRQVASVGSRGAGCALDPTRREATP